MAKVINRLGFGNDGMVFVAGTLGVCIDEGHLDTACQGATKGMGETTGDYPPASGEGIRESRAGCDGLRRHFGGAVKMVRGLLRVPFVEVEEGRKILTVYWTSRVEKYWEVNNDEDSV